VAGAAAAAVAPQRRRLLPRSNARTQTEKGAASDRGAFLFAPSVRLAVAPARETRKEWGGRPVDTTPFYALRAKGVRAEK
jgi:hypothetical protein